VGEDRQDRPDAAGHPSSERVSVPQAADHLGTTVDAIRKHVQRGTIPYEKDADGRVWILLDTGRPRQDNDQDTTGRRQNSGASTQQLAQVLAEHNAYLREQLRREQDAHAEARRIIAGLVQRIPELEPPREVPTEVPEAPTRAATEQPGRVEPQAPLEGAQTPTEATDEQQGRGPIPEGSSPQAASERPREERSWWRRMFGG
jgi:hypothetical protein